MVEMVEVEVIKVDRKTLNSFRFPLSIPKKSENMNDEEILEHFMWANVGDFVKIEDRIYRRVRGGFRKATDEDMAELIASQI